MQVESSRQIHSSGLLHNDDRGLESTMQHLITPATDTEYRAVQEVPRGRLILDEEQAWNGACDKQKETAHSMVSSHACGSWTFSDLRGMVDSELAVSSLLQPRKFDCSACEESER